MAFEPITTQEDLDNILKGRLERVESKIRAEYSDYETLKEQLATLQSQSQNFVTAEEGYKSQIEELNKQVKRYESDSVKTKAVLAKNLPLEFVDRLKGETEEEIQADAEKLAGLFKPSVPPMASTEKNGNGDTAYRELLNGIMN